MKIGYTDFDEKQRSQTNALILGSVGYGKSKAMEYMMRQDLAARQPFCLVDMHGTLYQEVKKWCAHNVYLDRRLFLVDPSEGRYVVPQDLFVKIEGVDVGVQTSSMVDSVMSAWGDDNPNLYPVMYKLLKVFFTIVVEKHILLSDAFQLLGARKKLTDVIHTLSDPNIHTIWADLSKLPQFEWSRQVTPTLNRLFRIVQSRAIQRFMCTGGSFPITFKDTILVNLGTSGTLDRDAANMFAVLLINALYQHAKRRRRVGDKDPPPYFVYIDEWVIPTPDFSRILAECRKFGLLLVLCNQDLSQIKTAFGQGFTDTLLTLCQMQMCFGGLNDHDASRLSREWGIDPVAIRMLGERQCFLKLPRKAPERIDVPEIREPFVRPERLLAFEDKIAVQNKAMTVIQADAKLRATPINHIEEDETIDGWAVQ